MQIRLDDLRGPEIAELLEEHLRDMHATSPRESVHALDLCKLRSPDISFWTIWDHGRLAGCAALRQLSPTHGEIKSMRTAAHFRRRGVASKLLEHILEEAGRRGYRQLSLETGSMEYFAPARQLYTRFGFVECGPFADYRPDPHSSFMTLHLRAEPLPMHIRPCSSNDAPAICAIYNHYVLNSVITFEEIPVGVEEMWQRIESYTRSYPWLVCESAGKIVGYAYACKWKERAAYRNSVETSVYVDKDATRKGVGKALYSTLVEMLFASGCHVIIGGIALPNLASVRLHEYFGFQKVAHFPEVGYKFGQWVDVGYWQKTASARQDGGQDNFPQVR